MVLRGRIGGWHETQIQPRGNYDFGSAGSRDGGLGRFLLPFFGAQLGGELCITSGAGLQA
jgi:hypothetical protein